MVLTDRQRADLHAGIHEYLLSQPGEAFAAAARAVYNADPDGCARNLTNNGNDSSTNSSSATTLLEKKWTAVPRLQKRVLELERALASSAGPATAASTSASALARTSERRNIPRPPALHSLTGHTAAVNCVSLHPTYSLASSGSDDGTIKLWDVDSAEFLKTLKGHTNTVTHVAFDATANGGRLLASCSTDLSIKLWEWKEGTPISDWTCVKTLRGHDHTISAVVFVPVLGMAVGSSSGSSGILQDASTAKQGAVYLFSASRDTTIRLWEVATGFCIHTYSDRADWVRCLAITTVATSRYFTTASKSGVIMASGSNDSLIKLWTVEESDHKSRIIAELRGHDHVVECVSFVLPSALGAMSSSSSQRSATSTTAATTMTNKAGQDISTLLVSGSRDKAVKVWNFVTQECLFTFAVHDNWVRSVLLHPSGNFVISAGDDRSIRVLDLKVRQCYAVVRWMLDIGGRGRYLL